MTTTEGPDYTDRNYQKTVLDAVWEGADWQVQYPWEDNAVWRNGIGTLVAFMDCLLTPNYKVRIKPEPIMIPLEASDLPAVCWLRLNGGGEVLLMGIDGDSLAVGRLGKETFLSLMDWEYSPDRKNWYPCSKPQS